MSIAFEPGHTIRSACGRARATYHPEWSATDPWVTYIDGTAGRHFSSHSAAMAYLRNRGFRFGG